MADWKGKKVWINVYDLETDFIVDEIDTYLDTDTMSDIFDRYPLGEHMISIMKAKEEEDS